MDLRGSPDTELRSSKHTLCASPGTIPLRLPGRAGRRTDRTASSGRVELPTHRRGAEAISLHALPRRGPVDHLDLVVDADALENHQGSAVEHSVGVPAAARVLVADGPVVLRGAVGKRGDEHRHVNCHGAALRY